MSPPPMTMTSLMAARAAEAVEKDLAAVVRLDENMVMKEFKCFVCSDLEIRREIR